MPRANLRATEAVASPFGEARTRGQGYACATGGALAPLITVTVGTPAGDAPFDTVGFGGSATVAATGVSASLDFGRRRSESSDGARA